MVWKVWYAEPRRLERHVSRSGADVCSAPAMSDSHEARAVATVKEILTPEAYAGVSDDMIPVVFSPIYQPVHDLIRAVAAEALEQAATIADAHDEVPAPGTIDTGAIWRGASARMIAAAIRALAPKED